MGEERNAYRSLVGKTEGRTWDDINKMDLKKYNWMAWAGFVWLRIATSWGNL
jgi:hypothetical protein